MKKSLFFAVISFTTAICYSQNYNISFIASGIVNTFDSIIVKNNSIGTSLKLYDGDILHLMAPNSINNVSEDNENAEIFPNPMIDEAKLLFYAKQTGSTQISISDISGKIVLQTTEKLLQGNQNFNISGLKQGVFFINIIGNDYRYNFKLLSNNNSQDKVKIEYIGNYNNQESSNAGNTDYSSIKSKYLVNMAYISGNILEFTGYSGSYSYTIYDIPTNSKTITFTFGVVPCVNFTATHTAGDVAPVTKTVTYNVVSTTLFGGTKCAITQNLGADEQANSATDNREVAAGWYWQFNRKQGFKHDGTTRTPNTAWGSLISENNDWLSTNDPCNLLLGSSWRIPTNSEWSNADNNGGWNSFNSSFNSVLKIHATGYISNYDGSLLYMSNNGYRWSSTDYNSTASYSLYFINSGCIMNVFEKSCGFNIRCIRE